MTEQWQIYLNIFEQMQFRNKPRIFGIFAIDDYTTLYTF